LYQIVILLVCPIGLAVDLFNLFNLILAGTLVSLLDLFRG
jgi:hypothetical protein